MLEPGTDLNTGSGLELETSSSLFPLPDTNYLKVLETAVRWFQELRMKLAN